MGQHKTKTIHLEQINVDEPMVPLIKWLNKFDSIHTLFCCQGDKTQNPYVSFQCRDLNTMIYILQLDDIYSIGTIKIRFFQGSLEYNWELSDTESRDKVIKWVTQQPVISIQDRLVTRYL